jgi:hypothetical protein
MEGTSPVILCCYTNLNPKTEESIKLWAPNTQLWDVSGSEHDYWEVLSSNWTGERDIILIEHDIEITKDVIPSFTDCDQNWCTYSYQGPPTMGYLYRSFGCTRFSAALQRFFGYTFRRGPVRWDKLDHEQLFRNLNPHVHGHVIHHHSYMQDSIYACMSRAEFATELQFDGSIIIYENDEHGKRTNKDCLHFTSYSAWADWAIMETESANA